MALLLPLSSASPGVLLGKKTTYVKQSPEYEEDMLEISRVEQDPVYAEEVCIAGIAALFVCTLLLTLVNTKRH